MDIYNIYREFWDFSFENPEKIKPTHVSIFSFAVEHCNRLGWKKKFGFPTSMVMEATGIKSYSVFKKHFDDLINYGLLILVEYSKNQYSSNIIALKENDKAHVKAHVKALDKALIKLGTKHMSKQSESTVQSIDSIIKQIYNKQYTNIQLKKLKDEIDVYLKDEKKNEFDNRYYKDDKLNNIFNEYLKLRKKNKLSISETVITRLKNKLNEFSKGNVGIAVEVIEKAITSNWKDFYPIKKEN